MSKSIILKKIKLFENHVKFHYQIPHAAVLKRPTRYEVRPRSIMMGTVIILPKVIKNEALKKLIEPQVYSS